MRKKVALAIAVVLFICGIGFGNIYGEPEKNPAITNKDIIYFVMTDRFENGDKTNDFGANPKDIRDYNGGDLQGIINKLDYIKDLGATAIWITPVADNSSGGYHGYWTIDFYKVDEHLGDIEKLKELVSKAHEKEIKIILDLVVNHTGVVHPWVADEQYANWFHDYPSIRNWDDQNEVEKGKLAGLPDLAQENPDTRKYLLDMAKWWIKETGVDGFRLDTVRHVPKDFWEEFTAEIKKDYPDFYMIGEVFNGDHNYVSGYERTGMSGMVDFPMYYAIRDVFGSTKKVDAIKDSIERSSVYHNRSMYGTFIDNHDVPRFVSQAGSNKEQKLKQALLFQMTYTGIPIVYYGTEIAMEGSEDPMNRKFMDWSKESEIRNYLKNLMNLRKTHPVFTDGDITVTAAQDYFLAYERNTQTDAALILFNVSNKPSAQTLQLSRELVQKGNRLVNALDSKDVIPIKGTSLELNLAPKEAKVYMVEKHSSPILYILLIPVLMVAGAALYMRRRKR